jgi:phage terminase large subunit-like protein
MSHGISDYIDRAERYLNSVTSGARPLSAITRSAIVRSIADHENPPDGYLFDPDKATAICRFVEKLPHVKGRWNSDTLILEDWQCWVLTELFGWVDTEGFRRYKTAYIEMPRKNGKSFLSSGIALWMLGPDGEPGSEVYAAARTKEQARIVFDTAKAMCLQDRMRGFLRAYSVEPLAQALSSIKTMSTFRAVSKEHDGNLDGLNVHTAIIDELHAHQKRDVVDVMQTATGARRQPLIFEITTAGTNLAGICYEHRGYTLQVISGRMTDPEWFGVIYTPDDGDQWDDPTTWQKANPNYGVSLSAADLEKKARQGRASIAAKIGFETRHLCRWHNAGAAAWDIGRWRRLGANMDMEEYKGRTAYVGLDLSIRQDFTSRVVLVEDGEHWLVFPRHFLPEVTMEQTRLYQQWQNHITVTPGEACDYATVEDDLKQICELLDVREITYDPWNATQMAQNLTAEALPMIEIRATTSQYSPAMKLVQRWIMNENIRHTGCPVLTWMMSNVVCKEDVNENIFPRKESPDQKIDGAIALIMAANRAQYALDPSSVYDSRGLLFF